MSTVVVALILLSFVFVVSFLFVWTSKRQAKKRTSQLLHRFSTLGTENNLSFSSQEIFRSKVIGVDGVQRKILVLEHLENNAFDWYFIDLKEVQSCKITTQYATPPVPTAASGNLNETVAFIGLEFRHRQSGHVVSLPFYQHLGNSVYELSALKAKAKDWESMLSKMLISK